jgi:CRISPR-associated protein Csx14
MKRTLLAVCGTSPQVITETLYALHQEGRLPTSVRVLTTRTGKDRCIAALFGSGDGAFYRWCDDYNIDRTLIDFAPQHIIAVAGRDGTPLLDIADAEENELFLTACMEAAFAFSRLPEETLYYSLSGGRKTMSACLSTAAQFYGRSQDRLFHVLVSPEFESNRDFYFPPREAQQIELFDEKRQPYLKSTAYARINLITMPFVSIRERIAPGHLQHPETPADLLSSLIREPLPTLTVDLKEHKLLWKGIECDLSPTHLALYAFFVLRKKESDCLQETCSGCRACFMSKEEILEQKGRIADLYRRINPLRDFEAMSKTGILNLDEENLKGFLSRLHDALMRGLGTSDLDLLAVDGPKVRPKRYGIALPRQQLRLVM